MSDQAWAELAQGSREALRQLGYTITPQCLPGEPDECGGTFAQHAMAHLATLKAVADHHLMHLGPDWTELHGEIYWDVRAELENCGGGCV